MVKQVMCTAGVILAMSAPAFGQSLQWNTGRIFANVSIGAQLSPSRDEKTSFSFSLYDEPATVDVSRSIKGGLLGDLTVGGKVLGNLGVASSIFYRSNAGDSAVTASIPDPIVYDRARTVGATLVGMKHTETWSAVQAAYLYRVNEHASVTFLAGPAIVQIDHEIADSATVTEGAATPTVDIGRSTLSKLVWGFSVGADGRYMVTPSIGFGGFIRYASAKANMNAQTQLTVGGFQMGAGIRISIK